MQDKVARLSLLSMTSIQMRVFHLTWLAFFVCASTTQHGLYLLGIIVASSALCAFAVRFSRKHKHAAQQLYHEAITMRQQLQPTTTIVRVSR